MISRAAVNMKLFLFLSFAFGSSLWAEKPMDIQALTVARAADASWAVIPLSVWYDLTTGGQQKQVENYVAGTGFLVDQQGDFVTAAHVLDISQLTSHPEVSNARVTATIRQGSGDATGQWFTVVETDTEHDLALCHITGFRVYTPQESPTAKAVRIAQQSGAPANLDYSHPFASLGISQAAPVVGRFVIVSGFPLGAWTPTIQLGMVSATKVVALGLDTGIKDHRDLLQIAVSANHGNSGGPVIDLSSGEVVGVLLQLVPAPVVTQGRQIYDPGNFAMSGIMLAAPASWVNSLLERHQIKSKSFPAGKLVIF